MFYIWLGVVAINNYFQRLQKEFFCDDVLIYFVSGIVLAVGNRIDVRNVKQRYEQLLDTVSQFLT